MWASVDLRTVPSFCARCSKQKTAQLDSCGNRKLSASGRPNTNFLSKFRMSPIDFFLSLGFFTECQGQEQFSEPVAAVAVAAAADRATAPDPPGPVLPGQRLGWASWVSSAWTRFVEPTLISRVQDAACMTHPSFAYQIGKQVGPGYFNT